MQSLSSYYILSDLVKLCAYLHRVKWHDFIDFEKEHNRSYS